MPAPCPFLKSRKNKPYEMAKQMIDFASFPARTPWYSTLVHLALKRPWQELIPTEMKLTLVFLKPCWTTGKKSSKVLWGEGKFLKKCIWSRYMFTKFPLKFSQYICKYIFITGQNVLFFSTEINTWCCVHLP